eukprot:jgi/Tetstr1/447105/TSEL_034543.t1
MTIPLGALCSTGRIVEDVRQALFRGQATNNHIRVHPEQPQGGDAFGYAFADIVNNCAEPKQYDVAGKKHMLEAGSNMGTGVKNVSADGPSHFLTATPGLQSTLKGFVSTVQRNKIVSLPPAGTAASPKLHGLAGVLTQQQKSAGGIIKHNTNEVKNLAARQAVPGDNVDEGSRPEPLAKKAKQPAKPAAGGPAQGRGGARARAGGGALGSRAGRRAAVAATATREQQAGRRGGPGQNRM